MNPETESSRTNGPSQLRTPWISLLGLLAIALVTRASFLFLALNNGTDAWARYQIARSWMRNPATLPSEVWLPLHFWLLGGSLWVWDSEWSVRIVTALFGTLTLLPFWGIVRRAFDESVGYYSTLLLALFGHHIAYSVTSSSEAPTIFFLVLGVYAWVRSSAGEGDLWLVVSGLALSCASLCRFEAWLYVPVLSLALLHPSDGWARLRRNRQKITRAVKFALVASAGAAGWAIFSFLKWGDPLAAPHHTFAMNARLSPVLQQPWTYRLIAVPSSLLVSLSPLVFVLAIVGVVWCLSGSSTLRRHLSILAIVLAGAGYYAAVAKKASQARYTLMYSWLLIPLAFEGLRQLGSRWRLKAQGKLFAVLLATVLLWQAGIIIGAYSAPGAIADRLSTVSPFLPMPVEIRAITAWLKNNRGPGDAVIVDEFHFQANDIIRFSGISFSEALRVQFPADPNVTEREILDFVTRLRPRLLVYSPYGQIAKLWPLGGKNEVTLGPLTLSLRRVWKGNQWSVYEIIYPAGAGLPNSVETQKP